MKKIIFTLFTLFITFNVFSQISSSKETQINQTFDTSLVQAYINMGKNFQYSYPDSALYYHQLLLDQLNNNKLPTKSLNSLFRIKILREIAWDFYLLGEFKKSIKTYKEGVKELKSEKIKDIKQNELYVAHFNADIGVVYMQQGEFSLALEYLFLGLKNYDKIEDKQGQSTSCLNIGIIYYYLKKFDKSLEYLDRAKSLNNEINDVSGIGNILIMMGAIHLEKKSYDLAIKNFSEALIIQQDIGDNTQINACLANLGMAYRKKGEFKKAIEYYNEALYLSITMKNLQIEIIQLINLGTIYSQMNNCKRSISYFLEAIPLAQRMNSKKELEALHKNISEAYYQCRDFKKSLTHYQQYIIYRDSLHNEKTNKELFEKELKYSFDKKATADSVANAKSQEIKDIEIARQKVEKLALRNQQYALFGGFFLVLVFAGFMYNRFKVTQKQKNIIQQKNKEITDSINYAERIQRSFLATKELLDENLSSPFGAGTEGVGGCGIDPNYFVFFQPKDVVSGDFYWAGKLINGNFAIVNADSTGHGVPGAIMSILNISSIEKAVDKGLVEPNEIFNDTRKTIIERLKKDGSPEGGKDGMDASLISINPEKTKMAYVAAQNPIWIIRNDELIEIKPEKMPVGKHENDTISFVGGEVDLQTGDLIYTITDGFQDQFGGEKGKKFMVKNLKNKLLEIVDLPMHEQEQVLADEFDNWKGENEQVDDVCIIGVRI